MLLVFIDETTDVKFKDYLGFSIATINAAFYPQLKKQAQKLLTGIGWDPDVEFKGSYLFSASKGCSDILIERRIEVAGALLDLNVANSNRRMTFHFGHMSSDNHGRDYLGQLPGLLYRVLPTAPKGPGKNLIAIHCDERPDVQPDALHEALQNVVIRRGYVLLERVSCTKSTFDTVGIMYADLVAYLAGRIETIKNDVELFEGLDEVHFEQNGKIRKLKTSTELIRKIKKLKTFSHQQKPALAR